ncbi:hypothetical protein XELAEV_18013448mg [Xenopus laevis]|uniref:Uncharacterized protein n=1 Tax=Xenopus laevis TaxID=8355 RepID=A0A974HZM3_XENLA|nr:hypothetical protein XELAEV_18013448mg [Xenopus laevis]
MLNSQPKGLTGALAGRVQVMGAPVTYLSLLIFFAQYQIKNDKQCQIIMIIMIYNLTAAVLVCCLLQLL